MKLYQAIARDLERVQRGESATDRPQWLDNARESLARMVDRMPSGSGLDSGVKLADESTPERLVFTCDFHHMNEGGYYDGWTEHKCIVRASLVWGIDLRITGRNKRDIKDYLTELLQHVLMSDVTE